MAIELEHARHLKEGVPIAKIISDLTVDRMKRNQILFHHHLSTKGVPKNLQTLFSATKKSDAQKLCQSMIIDEHDLFLLIHNCNQIDYLHESKFLTHVPEHLEISEEDRKQFKEEELFRPLTKKLGSIFRERKALHAHLFIKDNEWHCFYFDFKDIEESIKNHWKHGCHIHYISSLWGQRSPQEMWEALELRQTRIPGKYHIKFEPYEYPGQISKEQSTENSLPDELFSIKSNLDPNPSAHLATRGSWSITVSTPSSNTK